MSSYFITGASRGIGLELVTQLLARPSSSTSFIIAASRSAPSGALATLLSTHAPRLAHVQLSVDSDASVHAAASSVDALLAEKNFAGLDVLVNNAGISGHSSQGAKTVPASDLARILDTNVVGVHRVTQALLPALERGKEKKVIMISSTLGSITRAKAAANTPAHMYKVSKAALNMLNAQYANDYREQDFSFVTLSPGWLKTDLGSDYAHLPVGTGVKATLKIIDEANPSMSGNFYDIKIDDGEFASFYPGGEVPF